MVTAIGMYYLMANYHIDIFPGTRHHYNDILEKEIVDRGYVSLMEVLNPESEERYAQVNTAGYLIAFIVIIGVQVIFSFSMFLKIARYRQEQDM